MVYQDKLDKFNHKKGFYLRRRILIISLTILGLGFAIFIPTYIFLNKDQEVGANAENNDAPISSLSFE